MIVASQPVMVSAQTDTDTPTATNTATATSTATATNTATATATSTATATATNTATSPPPIVVTSSEPSQIQGGAVANLSVFGNNFTESTTVRLVGFGLLEVDFINANALFAEVPKTVATGTYSVEVSDPIAGTQISPNTLTILAAPTNTSPPPSKTPTLEPSTPIPGQPSLAVVSYLPIPQKVVAGDTVRFNITIVNQGNRTAMNPTAAFATGGTLIPSNAQTNISLPNIGPNAVHTFSLDAVVAPSATKGLNSVTLNLNYGDFEFQTFNAQSNLSVEVDTIVEISQLTLKSYSINPDPVKPGAGVDVNLVIANTGTQTAERVRLTVPPSGPVLLAGPQGGSFELGNIVAGGEVAISLPLIVSGTAIAGIQPQAFQLAYIQDGEAVTLDVQATISVASSPAATLLMTSYSYGTDTITPGERFLFEATIVNISGVPVNDALVSFVLQPGTVGLPFNVIEGGGTVFIDEIPANSEGIKVSQEFISSSTITPGVIPLAFSVRYNRGANNVVTELFNASILVSVPPRLTFNEKDPVPSSVNVGETINLSVGMFNSSTSIVEFVSGTIRAENLDILSNESLNVQTLMPNTEVLIEGTLMGFAAGDAKIILEFVYRDVFGQEQTLSQDYTLEVLARPTPRPTVPIEPRDFDTPQLTSTEPEEHTLPDDFWERFMLGFLGLGY